MLIKAKKKRKYADRDYKKSTFYLAEDLDIALRTLALEKRLGLSEVIEESVKTYLQANGKPVPTT